MTRAILFLTLTAGACAPNPPVVQGPDSLDAATAAATITPGDVHDRIAFLASDELRGRGTPSPELETAARWIADELASYGLQPAGEEGWLQRYPYPAVGLDAARSRLHASAGATHAFEYGRDFFAWAGAEVPMSAEVVYSGDGVAAAADRLDGRVALLPLSDLPVAGRRGLVFSRVTHRRIGEALDAAAGAGALAVVFILDRRVTIGEVGALAAAAEETRRVLGGAPAEGLPLPVFFVTRVTAERIFSMADMDAGRLLDGAGPPVPLSGLRLGLAAPLANLDEARPPNVVGVLPGADPELRDSYVVLTAHMDHVGVGRPDQRGDSIYNGADDNASGVAVLLEVAQAMSRLREPPRRSVVFLAVSGEEEGLLGSRWFVEHPTVPLDRVVANINLDMVGRNAPDSIVALGQDHSTLGALVQEVARRHRADVRLTVSEDLWPEQRFFYRSDHFHFARMGIPALFFFAGTHEEYHRPGDEVEDIDTDKVARVARLVFHLTAALAFRSDVPEWDPQSLAEVREMTR